MTSLGESCDNGNRERQTGLLDRRADAIAVSLLFGWSLMSPLIRQLLRTTFYLASALVSVLSLAPAATLPPTSIDDKAGHVLAYALLGLLGGASSQRSVLRTFLGLAALGIAIEMLQTFSPSRSPETLDVLADIVGAALGCGAAVALRPMVAMVNERIVRRRIRLGDQPIQRANMQDEHGG